MLANGTILMAVYIYMRAFTRVSSRGNMAFIWLTDSDSLNTSIRDERKLMRIKTAM